MKRLIETSPGTFEEPRHRYMHHANPQAGDTVLHSELLDDGTWSEWHPIKVVAG